MAENTFVAQRWALAWPYSTISDIAFEFGCRIFYLWSGLAVYFLLSALGRRTLNLRGVPRALWISVLVFVAATAGVFALAAILPAPPMVTDRHISAGKLIIVHHWQGLLFRCNYFFALLISAWASLSGREDEPVNAVPTP